MENLAFMKRTADKLFGDDYQWSVLGAGRHQMHFATQAVMMGGNVRVGLEDYQYNRTGQLSNPQIVERAVTTIRAMGYEVASIEQAREILEV